MFIVRTAVITTLLVVVVNALLTATLTRIILMSDIHYDPLFGTALAYGRCTDGSYSTTLSAPGCDSPLGLVTAAISDAIAPEREAGYLLMTGDWLRHGTGDVPWIATSAFAEVARQIARFDGHIVPLPNVAGTLGNNDLTRDYYFDVSHAVHPLLQNMTEVLSNQSVLLPREAATFSRCGFYARDVNDTTLTLVVLNTLVWSTSLEPPLPLTALDPCGQFEFLQDTLDTARARGRRVYLLSHIPPVINVYGVLTGRTPLADSNYWRADFTTVYRDMVRAFQDVIAAQFFGHTHQFSFLADADLGVPLFIVPSVTRVFGNNPSYLVATVDPVSWNVIDLRQRYQAADATWVDGLSVRSALAGGGALSVEALRETAMQLEQNATAWATYLQIHGGGLFEPVLPAECSDGDGGITERCRNVTACAMISLNRSQIASCIVNGIAAPSTLPPTAAPEGSPSRKIQPGIIAVAVICGIGGFAAIIVAGYVKTRKTGADADPLVTSTV